MKKEAAKRILDDRCIPIEEDMLFKFLSDKEVFEALLVMGVNPNHFDNYFGVPILSLAYSRYEYTPFKLLLDYGADPNVPSSTDMEKSNIVFELLMSYPYNIRFFKKLLKCKVDLNVKHPTRKDPLLIWLLKIGTSLELVDLLLKNGVRVNDTDRDGATVFDLIENKELTVNSAIVSLLQEAKNEN